MLNPYRELEVSLANNHLYFNHDVLVDRGGERVVSLSAYCIPILSDSRVERIKELVDENVYVVSWFPNTQQIEIKLKP